MTDMRATERLLEFIGERLDDVERTIAGRRQSQVDVDEYNAGENINCKVVGMRRALAELSRRGDTLVRRHDLVRVIEHDCDYQPGDIDYALDIAARERLENAIGRKP